MFFYVFKLFSSRPGRTVHCIYCFCPSRNPCQKYGPKPGNKYGDRLTTGGEGQKVQRMISRIFDEICVLKIDLKLLYLTSSVPTTDRDTGNTTEIGRI